MSFKFTSDFGYEGNIKAMRYDYEGNVIWDDALAFEPDTGIRPLNNSRINFKYSIRQDGAIWIAAYSYITPDEIAIQLQLLSADGERLLGDRGMSIPASSRHEYPNLITDHEDGLWLFWSVWNGEGAQCRVVHLDSEGNPLDEVDEQLGEYIFETEYKEPWYVTSFQYENGKVGVIYNVGRNEDHFKVQFFGDQEQSITEEEILPEEFSLKAAYPNPFNSTTLISYRAPVAANISIKLYNLAGRQVRTLVDGVQKAGTHRLVLNADNLASGLYFARMEAGDMVFTKKLVLIR